MAPSDSDFIKVYNSDNDYTPPSPTGAVLRDGGEAPSSSTMFQPRTSLLRTLWSEATSTTDLPPPPPKDHSDRLHHRRTSTSSSTTTATKFNRGVSGGSLHSRGHPTRHGRVTRGARVARRVWLAAFAALGASFIIVVHLFLYRVFLGGGGNGDGLSIRGAMTNKNGSPILAPEDMETKMSLAEARSHTLTPLTRGIDIDRYTIRINTWRRNEQLLLSLNHHAKCDGVEAIHVIWCDSENDPPVEVMQHPNGKVKVEYHTINSLNERFRTLIDSPTLGILSLDDDVLRPCVALDAAFLRWTHHPDRMVGFDARTHVVLANSGGKKETEDGRKYVLGNGERSDHHDGTRWKYGYMSTTETSNHYSMTLPRSSFIHREYLNIYTNVLPRPIYTYVAQNLECEDVAMSFLISSLTGGRPPLLADYWAVKSMVKLYSESKISGGKDHKATRDACVNDFATMLGLKEEGDWPLQTGKLLHSGEKRFFGYGVETEEWTTIEDPSSERLLDVVEYMRELRTSMSNDQRMAWLMKQKSTAQAEAQSVGMIEGTQEWKDRWSLGTH